jgi:mono/diheme cytochrome c family protein
MTRARLFALVAAMPLMLGLSPAQERGRAIYLTGESPSGKPILATTGSGGEPFAAAIVPCGSCHGDDGRGRAEGGVRPSALTVDALSRTMTVNGRTRPAYTRTLLKRAIGMGYDSGRNPLNAAMPRYQMTQEDMADLLEYLDVLGRERQPGVTDEKLQIAVIGDASLKSELELYGRRIAIHHGPTADAFLVIDASPDPAASLEAAERDRVPTIVVQSPSRVSGRWTFSLTAPLEDQRAALEAYARRVPHEKLVLLTSAEAATYDLSGVPDGHGVIVAAPMPPETNAARVALAISTSLLAQLGRNVTRTAFVEALEQTYRLETPILPPLTFSPSRHTATRAAWLMKLDASKQRLIGEPGWVEGE